MTKKVGALWIVKIPGKPDYTLGYAGFNKNEARKHYLIETKLPRLPVGATVVRVE